MIPEKREKQGIYAERFRQEARRSKDGSTEEKGGKRM